MRENGIFFTPVKYTHVCRTPRVSWAAQHTTVCVLIMVLVSAIYCSAMVGIWLHNFRHMNSFLNNEFYTENNLQLECPSQPALFGAVRPP